MEQQLPSPKSSGRQQPRSQGRCQFPETRAQSSMLGLPERNEALRPHPGSCEPSHPGRARRVSGLRARTSAAARRTPSRRLGTSGRERPRSQPSSWRPRRCGFLTSPRSKRSTGGRGAAQVGRGPCARGPIDDPSAAREKGAESPPREGRRGPRRRRASGRGWGRGGLPVSLAAATAATHPAPPDERYHWQQEEDGGRCRRRRGGGGGPVGAARRGYAQDVGVAATASFPPGTERLLLTTLFLASALPS
ncbi:hypothetical protein P7K49_008180 [Saguinus oedipus]|uniref:Uncharacterized protein n=1 Tax=Saguinus oedipus TaxID=9490 RepID=A0ABQ9VWZ6_SAGOE|nr:hypothetical protein P7K49_008180 [Saguinus oedipus]